MLLRPAVLTGAARVEEERHSTMTTTHAEDLDDRNDACNGDAHLSACSSATRCSCRGPRAGSTWALGSASTTVSATA